MTANTTAARTAVTMTESRTRRAVKLIREAEELRGQALAAERSFTTLHLVDGLRRQQHDAENALVRLMRPVYESVSHEEGMRISNMLHRRAGV